MGSRPRGSTFIYLIILVAAAFLVYSFYSQQMRDVSRTPLTEVAALVRDGKVTQIRVEGDRLSVKLNDGSEVESHKGAESTLVEQLRELGVSACLLYTSPSPRDS